MLYELRIYTVMPGRMPDLHKRFSEITLGYFKKHGIQVTGFWTNELGGASDQLIYILAYESLAERDQLRQRLRRRACQRLSSGTNALFRPAQPR